jgi:hypothetical protein
MYLESTMELLQQVHIKMVGYNPLYCFYPGDLHKYTLRCNRCQKSITAAGSIGATLYHAPVAMLRH